MAVVLITGGAGFIARHLIRRIRREHDIMLVDSLDNRVHPLGIWPEEVQNEDRHLGDYATTPDDMLRRAEIVVHLAAQVSVADSAKDPVRYLGQNSLHTATFLQRLPPNIKRVVVASSMSVYGEGGHLVREDGPVSPASVYGLSKYDQERLCLMWGQQKGIPVYAMRFFNVYGPEQSLTNGYTGVLANFAAKLLSGQSPTVYEDGQQTRDFVYVGDVVRALDRAMTSIAPSGVYNVCTGLPSTIRNVAETLARHMGKDIQPTITGTTRPGDIKHCTGSPRKAMVELGFQSQWTLDMGLKEYARWLTA